MAGLCLIDSSIKTMQAQAGRCEMGVGGGGKMRSGMG